MLLVRPPLSALLLCSTEPPMSFQMQTPPLLNSPHRPVVPMGSVPTCPDRLRLLTSTPPPLPVSLPSRLYCFSASGQGLEGSAARGFSRDVRSGTSSGQPTSDMHTDPNPSPGTGGAPEEGGEGSPRTKMRPGLSVHPHPRRRVESSAVSSRVGADDLPAA